MGKKYFGTDGIRGLVGKDAITPDFMLKLGWAAGKVFAREGKSKILIGKDTRISGYMFESALEAGLAAAGVSVALLGPMPTPAIAYLTRTFRAKAGIVISASHNPFYDNGIKFFSGEGTKLPDETELAIEKQLEADLEVVEPDLLGKAVRIEDAKGRYIEFCKSSVPRLSLAGYRIVLDCAHGATYYVAPNVFRELGAEVSVIGAEPDGININREYGSTSPAKLKEAVLEQKADLGIAFDGDGDRVIMVDHNGEEVDGDEILYIIAAHRKQRGTIQGGVVGTLMSNMGLELAIKELGLEFERAKVGDRYVMAKLHANQWSVGGESSGHVLCLDVSTTGDGIISALQVMAALDGLGQNLAEAKSGMSKFPQKMINVRLNKKVDLSQDASVQEAVGYAEEQLKGLGRVLLRPSGTEPVVRVMVEGQDEALVDSLVNSLADVVKESVS